MPTSDEWRIFHSRYSKEWSQAFLFVSIVKIGKVITIDYDYSGYYFVSLQCGVDCNTWSGPS